MLLTDDKIKVTLQMLVDANMTRSGQIGIPVNPLDASMGLVWKYTAELEDEDFDKIEKYFINKKP